MPDPFAAGPDAPRIAKTTHEGREVWIKRPERLTGRMRWQKGDPAAAFDRERRAHQRLADLGLPVPRIVASTSDYIATEAAGPSLLTLMRRHGPDHPTFTTALTDAATALAAFHAAGVSHGRPNLKDICWQDGDVRFLDFERAHPSRDTIRGHTEDLLLFFYNAIAETRDTRPTIDKAADAYRNADTKGIWHRAQRRAGWLAPLRHLMALLPAKYRTKKDFAAVEPFFAFFAKR